MQEDDVGLRELLPRLLADADVQVLVQRRVYQLYLVALYHLQQLLLRLLQPLQFTRLRRVLQLYLHPAIILEELYLVLAQVAVFLYLLEEVLAVQPHHLHRVQLHCHSSGLPVEH